MRRRRTLTLLIVSVSVSGCGAARHETVDRGATARVARDVLDARFARSCPGVSPLTWKAEQLAGAYNYPPAGRAGLVIARPAVQRGAIVGAIPVNRSARSVSYGYPYRVARRIGGAWRHVALPNGTFFHLPLLQAAPGRTGPCVTVLIPTAYRAGHYRIQLDHPSTPLQVAFDVLSPALRPSRWERDQERFAARAKTGRARAR